MDAQVVLGSASPRRKVLLARIVPSFRVQIAEADESPLAEEAPEALATRLAVLKAVAAAEAYPHGFVIGADTVVAIRDPEPPVLPWKAPSSPLAQGPRPWRILGKPADSAQAHAFLRQLGGRGHVVITAVAVALPSGETLVGTAHSLVWLREMTEAEIADYVATGATMDKAGGYAIQDDGFRPVARISGSETNVMGLPMALTRRLLEVCGAVAVRGRVV